MTIIGFNVTNRGAAEHSCLNETYEFRSNILPRLSEVGFPPCSKGIPLSCIPAVVMQKASQGPNWTENADNANDAEIVQVAYFL